MGFLALNHAFRDLGLQKVSGEVLAFNQRSLSYHQRLGFRIEGNFRKARVIDDKRIDVIRLALSIEDWLTYQAPYFEQLLEGDAKQSTPYDIGAHHQTAFTITTAQIRAYAQSSGDTNPIHYDPDTARHAGLRAALAPSTLLATAISRTLGTTFPGQAPSSNPKPSNS